MSALLILDTYCFKRDIFGPHLISAAYCLARFVLPVVEFVTGIRHKSCFIKCLYICRLSFIIMSVKI